MQLAQRAGALDQGSKLKSEVGKGATSLQKGGDVGVGVVGRVGRGRARSRAGLHLCCWLLEMGRGAAPEAAARPAPRAPPRRRGPLAAAPMRCARSPDSVVTRVVGAPGLSPPLPTPLADPIGRMESPEGAGPGGESDPGPQNPATNRNPSLCPLSRCSRGLETRGCPLSPPVRLRARGGGGGRARSLETCGYPAQQTQTASLFPALRAPGSGSLADCPPRR